MFTAPAPVAELLLKLDEEKVTLFASCSETAPPKNSSPAFGFASNAVFPLKLLLPTVASAILLASAEEMLRAPPLPAVLFLKIDASHLKL
jgi:hypothetical protein